MTTVSDILETRYFLYAFLLVELIIVSACSPIGAAITPIGTAKPDTTSTHVSEENLIATEQARAMAVKTEGALTRAAQSTFTLQPTQTSVLAHLPTLTAIPNSTPTWVGSFFDVPSDVLGSRYEIRNAYYFDIAETGERYEFYSGAIAGSGDEESAQGVMVLRVLQFSEQNNEAQIIETQEYLTPIQVGPLFMEVDFSGGIILYTPLHYEWGFFMRQYQTGDYPLIDLHTPPLARLGIGEDKQLAGRGSYCWTGGCADGPGIATSSIPLIIQSNSTATLYLPLEESPDGLELHALYVSPLGDLQYDYDIRGDRAEWSFEKEGRPLSKISDLALRQEQEITLDLDLGYYVLVVLAAWQDYGDVKYGFLIEVK
jgi:hypothetical protein